VDRAEEYFANGVLVHNCRYACLSRPFVQDAPPVVVRDSWDVAFQRAAMAEAPDSWRVA
jgi:hypothetical protein